MEADRRVTSTTSISGGLDRQEPLFNAQRFALARLRRGLKKTELAKAIKVEPKSILRYEAGQQPGDETLARLSTVLRFPREFFFGADIEEIDPSTVSFRSMARMTAGQQAEARGQGALCIHLNEWLSQRFALPVAAVPDVRHATPEAAASIVRTEWCLGVEPISNLVHLLESKGVRIYSLSIEAREVDAFSTWKGETPFIMLNVQKSSEHSRFDAAHELGHLVLHRAGSPLGKEAESEANRFASAFLMPEADLRAYTRPNPSLNALIQWKKRWKVSLAALNYRMHQLELITDHHYRNLCIQVSRVGGRIKEIEGLPRETSLLFQKVFQLLASDGVTRSQIARDLTLTTAELDAMMFGLTMTAHEGRRVGTGGTPSRVGSGLSLVE